MKHTPCTARTRRATPAGTTLTLSLVASLFLVACASSPPAPTTQIAVSTAALATAVSAGAPEPRDLRPCRHAPSTSTLTSWPRCRSSAAPAR